MYTTHTDHVVSVDDPEFSWSSSSSGISRSPGTPNKVLQCSSPASSLSSLSPSPPPSPSGSDSPSPVPIVRVANSTSDTSTGLSTRKSSTPRVTRSQIPKVRIRKLGAAMGPGAAPESDGGLSTSRGTSIPKPEGENGRPNRGGYSLSKVLGWNAKEYRAAQVCILFYSPHLISNIPVELYSQNCSRATTLQPALYLPRS